MKHYPLFLTMTLEMKTNITTPRTAKSVNSSGLQPTKYAHIFKFTYNRKTLTSFWCNGAKIYNLKINIINLFPWV